MKLTLFVVLISTVQMLAVNAYSQNTKFTLSRVNSSIEDVLKLIEDQSEYFFLYNGKLIDVTERVDINVENRSIEQTLDELLKDSNIAYRIYNRQVILSPRETVGILNQTQKVSGKVTDGAGMSLPGVTVVVKGTTIGTITDQNGTYQVSEVPVEGILVFSFVGMKTLEVSVGGKSQINVKLEDETIGLEEVVAIGYGVMKKSDLTGSIVSVKSEELINTPVTNALETLQGRVSGLDITKSSGQAGASVNFTIRGNRSLNASNSPLILVDGIQYGSYIDINPNDIQSVEVLKDASSTAIYGSRGANGVIIITTKKGVAGKSKIELNNYYGLNMLTNYQKVMNTDQYVDITREAYRADGQWSSPADDKTIFAGNYENIQKGINTDWPSLFLNTGTVQNNHLAVSGGTEKTSFRLSSEFYREKGLMKNDELQRFVEHFNIDHKVRDNFTVGATINVNISRHEKRNTSFWNLIKLLPTGEPYNEDGTIKKYPFPASIELNPLFDETKENYSNNTRSSRVFMVGYADWEIIKDLSFHTNFALDLNNSQQGIFEGKKSTWVTSNNGYSKSQLIDMNAMNWTWENTLNYNREIGNHSISLLAGSSMIKNRSVSFSAEGKNQPFESSLYYNLNTNTLDIKTYSNLTESQLSSVFGRINYKYNNRYLLTLSLRADGSSVLADGNKWAYFPSSAFAWRMKEESFMQDLGWLSDLKLRTSYGISGNSAIAPYQTQGGVSKLNFGFNETPAFGYLPTSIANKELSWEKTATVNLGVDFGLFDNKIYGTVDIYQTNTSDLLMQSILPALTGYTSIIANIGKTETKGIDFLISTRNISNSSFTWTSDFNFSTVKEKIVELSAGGDDVSKAWFVGKPINVIYDYEKIGIWQTSEAAEAAKFEKKPGEIKVKDQNGDGLITAAADRIVLGQRSPKWTAGLTNNFRYKNLALSVLMYARIGNMIDSEYLKFYYTGGIFNTSVVDYWTPENATNEYPRPRKSSDQYISTLGYVDGSFLKIKDIRVSYDITRKDIASLPVNKISIYGTAKNFFTFSKLKDYDVERGGSVTFPLTKQIVFGLNIEL